ncbi:MAG: hypothetical protein GY759_04695 [Chloroflexi bacterium]|nr:hypothetical protein [Chloroflexota bacterium]
MAGKFGPKPVVKNNQAVCSSSHSLVTDTMLQVMKEGGNAVDATIAGSMIQAVVEPHMTNHTGSVSFLYWEAATGRTYQLNGSGTLVPGLPPFRSVPGLPEVHLSGPGHNPCACIPGFMPSMAALHERFASKPWDYLCEPAIEAAEEGHVMSSFEYAALQADLRLYTYFPSGRALFTPDGFLPDVGERFRNPDLAKTLRRVATEGPGYFTEGDWAKHFVAAANALGWPINLAHMTAIPPQWVDPLRYEHRGDEVIQYYPPQRTGVFSALVLGILKQFDLESLGHYTETAEALYVMAHALRYAHWELGMLRDPAVFEVPVDRWLSSEFHAIVADIIWRSRPKKDLSDHVRIVTGNAALAAGGISPIATNAQHQPSGSCELSIVDPAGNWAQSMNTLQAGGIPGMVVDGVPMVGSHAKTSMAAPMEGWFAGGGRMRSMIGSTIVLREGRPWLGLGTPGYVYATIPQVLTSILDYGMDPYEASVLPRMFPLYDDYMLEIESRIPTEVATGLAQMGILLRPLEPYNTSMGSFQINWRDPETGLLNSSADPRRVGTAAGF